MDSPKRTLLDNRSPHDTFSAPLAYSEISWVAKFKGDKHIKIQNASCQMGVVAKFHGDKAASSCRNTSGREVTG